MAEVRRLVSFLGTGDYQAIRYFWSGVNDEGIESRYVAFALARMLEPREVCIACTEAAEATHGEAVRAAFASAGLAPPSFERLPQGGGTDELWRGFAVLRRLLDAARGEELVLDITHGFRSQPFFAGAVVSFVRALVPDSSLRIVYGAYDARQDGRAPIWELTPFVELVDWTHAIRQFVATGDARPLVRRAENLGRSLSKRWALDGQQGERPRLREFAEALRNFGDALAAVRVGELLLGRQGKPSAAAQLVAATAAARADIGRYAPPLAEVLGEIESKARALVIERDDLAGLPGRDAMAALAKLYLGVGRLAETAITLREGWVSLCATRAACRPGFEDFDDAEREKAEKVWLRASSRHPTLGRVRNDLGHGGFRSRPDPAAAIRSQLEQLTEEFSRAEPPQPQGAAAGTTWFVSRHAGAIEWASRRGIAVDRMVAHLDVDDVSPGDTVIGTLPVNLAARVCARGARYLNLSLELPEDARGRELSADDMERYGARLEPFDVRPGAA